MTKGKPPILVVMAAGIGSRYGDSKQIDPVGPTGETILDYSVFDAARCGFRKVVFVIRPELRETFDARIRPRHGGKIEIGYAYQQVDAGRSKPWGTGHALLAARDEVKGNFALITADDFYGRDSFRIMADHLRSPEMSSPGSGGLVGFRLKRTLSEHGPVSRGVCRSDGGGFLESIVERVSIEKAGDEIRYLDEPGRYHPLDGDEIVSMSFWGFQPSIFGPLEASFRSFLAEMGGDPKAEFFLPTVVDHLIRTGQARVRILPSEESWFGLTYPADRVEAVRRIGELLRRGIYPERL